MPVANASVLGRLASSLAARASRISSIVTAKRTLLLVLV